MPTLPRLHKRLLAPRRLQVSQVPASTCQCCARYVDTKMLSLFLELEDALVFALVLMFLTLFFAVICAFVAILSMLMSFLASALQDTGAEAHATVIHFSQAEQKILLNHIQLISLGKIVFLDV